MANNNQTEIFQVLPILLVVCLVITGILCFFVGIFTDVSIRCACWVFLITFQLGSILTTLAGFTDNDTPEILTGICMMAIAATSMLLLVFTKNVQWTTPPDSLKKQLKYVKQRLVEREQQLEHTSRYWEKKVANLKSKIPETEYKSADTVESINKCKSSEEIQKILETITINLNDKLKPALKRLKDDRKFIISRLRELGIESAADLQGDEKAQILSQELAEVVEQLSLLEKKQKLYEYSKFELEVLKRRTERFFLTSQAGLSDREMETFKTKLKQIEDRLNSGSDFKKQDLILDIDSLINHQLKISESE